MVAGGRATGKQFACDSLLASVIAPCQVSCPAELQGRITPRDLTQPRPAVCGHGATFIAWRFAIIRHWRDLAWPRKPHVRCPNCQFSPCIRQLDPGPAPIKLTTFCFVLLKFSNFGSIPTETLGARFGILTFVTKVWRRSPKFALKANDKRPNGIFATCLATGARQNRSELALLTSCHVVNVSKQYC